MGELWEGVTSMGLLMEGATEMTRGETIGHLSVNTDV